MDILPEELLFEIFKYLEFNDIIRCGITNQWINHVSKKDILWFPMLKEIKSKGKLNPNKNKKTSCRKAYQYYIMYKKLKMIYECIYEKYSDSVKPLNRLKCRKTLEIRSLATKFPKCMDILKPSELHLRNHQLTELPEIVCNWIDLNIMMVCDGFLKKLNPNIGHLKNLKEVILSHNKLTLLPSEIGLLENLEVILLDENQLTILPIELNQLHKLKKLNVSHNQLIDFPKQILNLQELTELNLNDNQISYIPNQNISIDKLTTFFISYNQLTNLPYFIGLINSLTYLDVSNNQLVQLPESISNLINLTRFDCSQNKLNVLPAKFKRLISLENLNLSHNNLTKLPDDFNRLLNLHHLQLDDNKFNEIPKIFCHMEKLINVYMQNNNINSMDILYKKGEEMNICIFGNPNVIHILSKQFSTTRGILRLIEKNILINTNERKYWYSNFF